MSGSAAILSVRVTPDERALLETAAGNARTSLSDFVRRKAIEAAETDLLDHPTVTISVADWETFETWTAAPAQDLAPLRKLAETPPAWRT